MDHGVVSILPPASTFCGETWLNWSAFESCNPEHITTFWQSQLQHYTWLNKNDYKSKGKVAEWWFQFHDRSYDRRQHTAI